MTTACSTDRIEMNQRERDILKIMQPVLRGERTQAAAAALLGLGVRQVRRIQRKLEAHGDAAVVHGLRGRPSNHQPDEATRRRALEVYRERYHDFGPTLAAEKMALEGIVVCPQTLRRWLTVSRDRNSYEVTGHEPLRGEPATPDRPGRPWHLAHPSLTRPPLPLDGR